MFNISLWKIFQTYVMILVLDAPHHAWRPINLDVSHQRQFHLPPVLFTRLMKNWGVPEIIAGKLLHSGQNFRGICKKDKVECFTPTMVPIIIIHTVEQ